MTGQRLVKDNLRKFVGLGLFLAALAGVTSPLPAERLTGLAGAFAPLGVSARTTALGGTRVVAAIGPGALFGNPAALPFYSAKSVVFHYFRVLGLLPYLAAAADFRLPDNSWAGVALSSNGDALYRENTLVLAYSRPLTWQGKAVDVGAALNFRYASFGNNASTPGSVTGNAVGAGLSFGARLWLTEHFALGLLLQDAPNYLRWSTSTSGSGYGEGLPVHLAFGAGAFDVAGMTFAFDWDKSLYRETFDRIHFGVERSVLGLLAVRGGYATALANPDYTEYSLGLGAQYQIGPHRTAHLDLSYTLQELPNILRLSFYFTF
jgi:hypothetical protein